MLNGFLKKIKCFSDYIKSKIETYLTKNIINYIYELEISD